MNALASSHIERATCLAHQAVVDNTQTRQSRRLDYLDPAQVQQELALSQQIAAMAERQLLAAVRGGDIRRARALLLQAAEAHAQVRGLSTTEAS